MLKIKELLKNLVDTQKSINENLVKLNKNIEPKIDTINTYGISINKISSEIGSFETNIYTKEETLKTINKEYDYRKKYEECKEDNHALLEMIETYCNCNDKYEVLKRFNQINEEYIIEKRK